MPADDYTDDYVAELLKRDAKATASSSASYSTLGSLLSKRPTGTAPKPNTRFLKNLIRHTDTHNAALLAKEAEESRARLNKLRHREHRPEQTLYSARARREGGQPLQPPTKKRRLSPESERGPSRKSEGRRHGESADRRHETSADRRHETSRDRQERTSSRRHGTEHTTTKRERTTSERHGERERSRSPRRHDNRRHRRQRSTSISRSPHRDRERDRQTSRHHQYRSSHRRHSPSPSPAPHRKHHPKRPSDQSSKPSPHREASSTHRNPSKRSPSPSSESDPLEAFLGPLPATASPPPPIRSKGRRAYAPSTIDAHFATTYDPTADIDPDHSLAHLPADDPDNDWDSALEALRDRQKWRQQGADRLRAAGFTQEEVDKWERTKVDADGNRVMDEENLTWKKNGEAREWDRGKVVDDHQGVVHVTPEWGRLKGT